jgi:hypothetical protein
MNQDYTIWCKEAGNVDNIVEWSVALANLNVNEQWSKEV